MIRSVSMLYPQYLVLTVGLLSIGCASGKSGGAVIPGSAGGAVVIEDHVGWPYELRRVVVTIDGTNVYDASTAGAAVGTPLAEGEHTMLLTAEYEYGGCALLLKAERPFRAGSASPRVAVSLYPRNMTSDFANRVDVSLAIDGQPAPVSATREARGEACTGREPLPVDDDEVVGRDASAERLRDRDVVPLPLP